MVCERFCKRLRVRVHTVLADTRKRIESVLGDRVSAEDVVRRGLSGQEKAGSTQANRWRIESQIVYLALLKSFPQCSFQHIQTREPVDGWPQLNSLL